MISFSSLRARLLFLALLIVLPALGLVTYTAFEQRKQKAAAAKEEALRLAGLVAANQKQLIEATRHLLVTLAKLPEVKRQDPQGCQELLSDLLGEYPLYTNFGVAALNGDIFCSALPMSRAVNIADRLYFRDAVKKKDFAIGEYQVGRITKKPAVNFGHPVMNSRGEVESVVYAAMDLKWFESIASEMKLPPGAMVTLIDRKGTILARVPDPEGWAGKSASDTTIGKIILTNKVGTAQQIGLDGEKRLYGFTTLRSLAENERVFVWVSVPEEVAFAEVERAFIRNLLLLGLITALILLVAWVGSDVFVLRGVNALINATETLAAGDLSARARLPSDKGELGRLAQSFNRMADSLEKRYTELQTLRDIDLSILSTLNLSTVLDLLIEKIDLHLPYSAATVSLWDETSGHLRPVAWKNIDPRTAQSGNGRPRRTLPNLVAEYRAPLAVENIQKDAKTEDREAVLGQGFKSYLGVPLVSKQGLLGVLSFYTREEHRFTNEEINFLTTLGGQTAIAIHNSQLYEQSTKQAEDLKEANKVKSEFLSVMSHELRTPLNVIMGYTAMIKEEIFGPINREQIDALNKVTSQSNEMLGMVTQILQATQIEAGEVVIDYSDVNLNNLLNDLRASYDVPTKKEIAFEWDYPSDLPTITTDRDKVKQILQNLIDNSIKFTEVGRISISVRELPNMKTIEFKVADTGVGIPKEKFPVVFEMFSQVDSSGTRSYGGVGLGLYIVKKYAELFDGEVRVESELGKGSTFTVILPCRAAGERRHLHHA